MLLAEKMAFQLSSLNPASVTMLALAEDLCL